MQFHETQYGARFFGHQLPELIRALNRVADALQAQKSQATTVQDAPAVFLWKDKSGRGFTKTFTASEVIEAFPELLDEPQEDDDDVQFRDWIESSEIGEQWHSNANQFTRIK